MNIEYEKNQTSISFNNSISTDKIYFEVFNISLGKFIGDLNHSKNLWYYFFATSGFAYSKQNEVSMRKYLFSVNQNIKIIEKIETSENSIDLGMGLIYRITNNIGLDFEMKLKGFSYSYSKIDDIQRNEYKSNLEFGLAIPLNIGISFNI